MQDDLSIFPPRVSEFAGSVDDLFIFLCVVSGFFTLLIFGLILWFAVKYRRRSEHDVTVAIRGVLALEVVWTVIPVVISGVIFFWGASLYFHGSRPPAGAMEVHVVAKQWMWKLQHPGGQREINELHVPVGRPVRLLMTSEDVIHSFFVPALRQKQDVLPGRYTSLWFEATLPGEYHLFCAEYCGTDHSRMIGRVVVMEPGRYERWLAGAAAGLSLAEAGERLFDQTGCRTCHRADATTRCPPLEGVFGKPVQLQNGQIVVADEDYIRESIVLPNAKLTAGYDPVMPTYKGQISEEGLLQLIAYIKSLATATAPGAADPAKKD
jgi:cytochrome c oxidase subunit 2